MDIKKALGNRIKEIRIKQKLTQEMLAEKINVSAKSLSQIELGNNFVSADTLYELCNALNIKPKVLFDFDYEEDSFSQEDIERITSRVKQNKKVLKLVADLLEIIEY